MKPKLATALAAVLLTAAFATGYVFNQAVGQPGASAAARGTTTTTSTSNSTSLDAATEHAYAIASKSVVFIANQGNGTGSGIIYDTSGDIVTNAHVTSGGTKFTVTFSNGKTDPGTLVGSDTADDLAVIHVSASGLTPARFASTGSYQVAEMVLAIGSPLGLKDSVTSGLISGINRTQQEPNGAYIPEAIQTSAPINPGNSGGALVALDGTVVGIPTMVQTSTSGNEPVQDVGFAIPSSRVTYIANQIIDSGKVEHTGRAFLGVSVGDASQQYSFGQAPNVAGAVVNQVEASGPAGKAGIHVGDVITGFDGRSITSSNDLLAVLAGQKPGASATVIFNRNGTSHTVHLTLSELPASQ